MAWSWTPLVALLGELPPPGNGKRPVLAVKFRDVVNFDQHAGDPP
jgi:hypothetical protein